MQTSTSKNRGISGRYKQGGQAYKAGRLTRQAGLQGRQAYKAGRPTRQAGLQGGWASLNNVPALTANIFESATNINNKIHAIIQSIYIKVSMVSRQTTFAKK